MEPRRGDKGRSSTMAKVLSVHDGPAAHQAAVPQNWLARAMR